MERKEAQFYSKLLSFYNHVLMYEDTKLQELYLSHIPVAELQARAEEIKKEKFENESKTMSLKDCLLLALLKWFKCKFDDILSASRQFF